MRYSKKSKIISKKRSIKKMFLRNFAAEELEHVFNGRISSKDDAGIDGIHPHDLKPEESFEIIERKVSHGTYHFTPYAEVQFSKGRGKSPRIIALATVRDQITLSALKNYLHDTFPNSVAHKLPNSYVFELNKEIQKVKNNKKSFGFIHTDISGFYDNIDREKMMNIIRSKVDIPEALKLIYRAVANPIVPRNSKLVQRFHYYTPKGVPQGLSISNILASIYMTNFDKIIKSLSLYYVRYVDDIIILCPKAKISAVMEKLHYETSKLGLELNKEKTNTGIINKDTLVFLGYILKADGIIGVKDDSVHRKTSGLAGLISSADHKKYEFLKLHKIDNNTYKKVLVEDINEHITGAISGKKRYGWLFYFSQINDMALLHRLDRIVGKLCERCHTFSKQKPKTVKSFVTAFREIHKIKHGIVPSYIPNYDDWNVKKKIKYLNE
jgi:RNA-directed DNA polymerase